MYPGREVFLNPPLQYVVAEIKYPYAPRLRQPEVRDAVLLQLEDLVPILRPLPRLVMTGIVGGPVSQQMDQVNKAFNRASTLGVTVTANALTIDTTAYVEFTEFRPVLLRAVEALDQHGLPAAIERVGLRFINEIHVPAKIANVRDWHGWVAEALLAPATIDSDHEPEIIQSRVEYRIGDNRKLAFTFASASDGAVIGNEPLKRRSPPPGGPFLAIDIDSFWQPPVEASEAWHAKTVARLIDELHDPVGAAFQAAVTDKLRESVLRQPNDK
jgi:uncharacterized protein (TIGR04255 family)